MDFRKMLLASAALACAAMPIQAMADTAAKKIALSNNYAGNSWRQAMLTSWEKVTGEAVKAGVVAAADPFTTAENQATEQAAQIQNMILQGYDAIVINAASPTALNGAVKEACDAGITVVSFDGIVTEPCAWRIAVDFKEMGRSQVEYLSKKIPAGGNLLEIRGLAGVFVDDEISAGIHAGVAGRRTWPKRPWPAFSRAFPRLRRSLPKAVTAMARPKPSQPPSGRYRPSSWATGRTN
jgi:ribose transport system substrate-binding protein